jgi:hypothetical protein
MGGGGSHAVSDWLGADVTTSLDDLARQNIVFT